MSWIKIRDFTLTIEFLWFELLAEKKKKKMHLIAICNTNQS